MEEIRPDSLNGSDSGAGMGAVAAAFGQTKVDWRQALNIADIDISPFTARGQWDPLTFIRTGQVLEDLLAEYAVALIGGKACVVRWKKDRMPDGSRRDALDMISKTHFNTFHSDKMVEVQVSTEKDGKKVTSLEKRPATNYFFPKAKRYDGLAYLPHQGPCVDGSMNLWRGFGVRPRKGDWGRMQEHIYEILASGHDEQAIYIIRWCAWAVQNPGIQAEVAKILKEDEGSGKGVYLQALLRIFGIHGLHISGSEHLVGHFNKHLMYCSLLYGDEVYWGGYKKDTGELKRLITEPTLTIEPKAVDTFQMPNCLHIIMASNENWVVPAGISARRFAVMDVSPKRIGDKAYFEKLWNEVNAGGPAAMLHDLLSMDLGNWHPRKDVPQTKALQQQKLLTLTGVNALVYMLANEGKLPCLELPSKPASVVTSGEGHGSGLYPWAKQTVRSLRSESGPQIKRALVEWGCNPFSRNGQRGLDFPKLSDLRADFEKRCGAVQWDNPEMVDWEKPADRGPTWHPIS